MRYIVYNLPEKGLVFYKSRALLVISSRLLNLWYGELGSKLLYLLQVDVSVVCGLGPNCYISSRLPILWYMVYCGMGAKLRLL